jgi:hypothetical protein
MREDEARVQKIAAVCASLLRLASLHLTILDPEVGEEELIEGVAAALARLRMP